MKNAKNKDNCAKNVICDDKIAGNGRRLQGRKICVSTCPRRPENGCGCPENEFGLSS